MLKITVRGVMALGAVLLLATNVFLHNQLHDARKKVALLEASQGPQVGSYFKGVTGVDLGNRPVQIDYANHRGKTLFLVLSPACQYCSENWPFWRELLAGQASGVVLADTSGGVTQDYFRQHGIEAPQGVIRLDSHMKEVYDLHLTPTTIVIGDGGRIEGVWLGLLTKGRVASIKKALN